MNKIETLNNLCEAKPHYAVFTIKSEKGTISLNDRQNLNDLNELNKYLSDKSGSFFVIGIKNSKEEFHLVTMYNGKKTKDANLSKPDANTNQSILKLGDQLIKAYKKI